jgi:hypothetical protein
MHSWRHWGAITWARTEPCLYSRCKRTGNLCSWWIHEWNWLLNHIFCISRGSTPDSRIYSYWVWHWDFHFYIHRKYWNLRSVWIRASCVIRGFNWDRNLLFHTKYRRAFFSIFDKTYHNFRLGSWWDNKMELHSSWTWPLIWYVCLWIWNAVFPDLTS